MSRKDEGDIFERSLAGTAPIASLGYWAEQTDICERELRRFIDDGRLVACQARPGTRGSTIRIPRAAIIDLMRSLVK